jgi:hypothetical protein
MNEVSDQDRENSQAVKLVSEHIDKFPREYSDSVEEHAEVLAVRGELEHPINREPVTIAAGAIYLAFLLSTDRLSQDRVEEGTGVSSTAVSKTYRELLYYEANSDKSDMSSWYAKDISIVESEEDENEEREGRGGEEVEEEVEDSRGVEESAEDSRGVVQRLTGWVFSRD